jgi:hypothetical protein
MRLVCAALLGAFAASSAFAADAPHSACFVATDFRNWHASDAKTVYIRAAVDRIYRADLSRECPSLLWPDAHLVMKTHGGDLICTALDLDLRVSQGVHDIPEPCFVKTLTELSPTDAAALPKGVRP